MIPLNDAQHALFTALSEARRLRQPVASIPNHESPITLIEAYQIQEYAESQEYAKGNVRIGFKLGLTSLAKQRSIGLHHPVYGRLYRDSVRVSGEPIILDRYIHPRVEPEIAVVLRNSLQGPGVTTAEVFDAMQGIVPALEILDSRYRDYRFTLAEGIADNTSHARAYVGTMLVAPDAFDWGTEGVVLSVNGSVVQCGAGAATMGHPATAVAWLANLLGEHEHELPAGSLILTGGLTEAVMVKAGDCILGQWQTLGDITLSCVGEEP